MSPIPKICKSDTNGVYFLTVTVIEWIDIFTKPKYFDLLKNTFQFCIEKKGLELYEYVFMTNHIHFIAGSSASSAGLDSIVRDFKKYTTHRMKDLLKEESRSYISTLLRNSYSRKDAVGFQIWQSGNYPEFIETDEFRNSKIQYIWDNPVKKQYVSKPEDWLYSSAKQKILNLPVTHPDVVLPCRDW
jgi:REP element-mobilizing transposase RayT